MCGVYVCMRYVDVHTCVCSGVSQSMCVLIHCVCLCVWRVEVMVRCPFHLLSASVLRQVLPLESVLADWMEW